MESLLKKSFSKEKKLFIRNSNGYKERLINSHKKLIHMIKRSVEDMVNIMLTGMQNENEFDITIPQEGLDINIHTNKEKKFRTISVNDLILSYDPHRFEEDSISYVTEQLNTHEDYHKLIHGKLLDAYGDLHDVLDDESSLERYLQFIPEDYIKLMTGLAKLFLIPDALIRSKTLKEQLKDRIIYEGVREAGYKFIKIMIDYGKEFIDEILIQQDNQLSEKVIDDLEQWKKIQMDLSFLYSNFIRTVNKKTQAAQRFYDLMFLNSKI